MNEAPNHTSGLNDTFSSQSSPQTNPFTADLKGEFTSNFGTNTNAVSQIFKEGGFVGNNRSKYLIAGGVAVVVLAILFFVFTSSSSEDSEETASEDESSEEAVAEDAEGNADESEKAEGEEATAEATEAAPAAAEAAAPAEAPVAAAAVASSGASSFSGGKASLSEPMDGASISYDESQGAATFTWSGGGGYIVFSRSASMSPVVRKVSVSGNSYSFQNPWPGTWYWKVQNSSGSTEVRSFTVTSPQRRNIQVQQPTAGGAVAGNGGTVSWQGDSKVAYYRVEMSSSGFANPAHRFSSSGNSVQLQGVAPGQYQMRVGAFSEVSGRWEYTQPQAVTVQ